MKDQVTRLFSAIAFGPFAIAAIGCHSYHIETTVENDTGSTVQLLEVEYPSASFGTENMVPGATFHYRIQLRGEGPLKLQFTSNGKPSAEITGPEVEERQEGTLEIVLLPGGNAEFHPQLTPRS